MKIYGGNVVKDISEFPFIAQYLLNDSFACGAVIISEMKLITCAHCLPEDKYLNITTQKIRAGSIDPNGGGEIRNVSRYIINPHYDEPTDHNNDVAILFLDQPLNLTTKAMKNISLAQPGKDDDSIYTNLNNEFILNGYGPTESTNDIVNLRWLQGPLVNLNNCTKIYANLSEDPVAITDKMFCAGNEQFKFVREGDSGGKL